MCVTVGEDCDVDAGIDIGVGVEIDAGGCFADFFDGVRSETCRNFKRYGKDGVRNNLSLDFLSVVMALSSRKSWAFLFFLVLSLVKGEARSVEGDLC